ncbi:DeoR/GlpR family DNA-binding transcription regulator [Virgibacillus sp. W0181]|uniref:DeoR/GlpR family DNA-binding transcription regulator n=1 Tax=Virgibacillus sp. W0181 TaxID=3391581 RepID=UPI003F47E366
MLILDRQNKVLTFVKKNRVATVAELAEHFKVHEATIRRDLSLLEKEGKLRRTHGGVMIEDEVHSEPPFQERESAQYDAKKRMGEHSGDFINDGDNIILDSGTTTVHIVEAVLKKKNITVITNDINIAAKLRSSPQTKVIVTGGNLFPESYMLNGLITDQALSELYVHTAFIGTPAFHHQLGLSHFDDYLVSAKRSMIQSAKKVIVVADHTKIGKVSLYKVAEVKEIDTLITTCQLDDEQKKYLTDLNIDVHMV